MVEENGEVKNASYVKQETVGYGYDPSSYLNYTTATTPTTLNQPLPGQPPLPPMPPPQGNVPPPPSVYGTVQAQVAPMQAWPHAAASAWHWMAQAHTAIPAQSAAAAAAAAAAAVYQRGEMPRNNYVKRERYNNHNRNQIYQQRGNFHRKNRNRQQQQRYDQQQQNQFDQAAYYGAALTNSMEWQRNNEAALLGMQLPMQNQMHMAAAVANTRRTEEPGDPDIKEEIVIKKNKQRKPMSQSYPSRPWNREDAERALKIENEYNKTVKAQSLIIKFPDPDLNKDIVREFHSGIQNIHFQSPSGPRYCFIQMAENVDIDKAIEELEKIPFGNGHLKVERKSLRDEDAPTPEEIDPYTLYIGNLPESVNVNEVKSKFQTAARVDVGYAQKMRNTRYAFIRYNSVDESIAAYKQAHDLMWDTRSIIVRFRRQRGNTCLPGEPKSNPKKKDEVLKTPSATDNTQEKDNKSNNESSKSQIASSDNSSQQSKSSESKNTLESNSTVSIGDSSAKESSVNSKEQLPQDSVSKPAENEVTIQDDDTSLMTEIKEEPIDYDDMNEMSMCEEDDDDDDEGEIYNHEVEEDDEDSDYDDDLSNLKPSASEDTRNVTLNDDIPSDNLDKMFSDLNNSIVGT